MAEGRELPFLPHLGGILMADLVAPSFSSVHQMEKEGLLKLKSTRDQDVIVSIDTAHAAVESFKPHRTIGEVEAKEKKKAAAAGGSASTSAGGSIGGGAGGEAKGKKIEVSELWKPHGSTTNFWSVVEQVGLPPKE